MSGLGGLELTRQSKFWETRIWGITSRSRTSGRGNVYRQNDTDRWARREVRHTKQTIFQKITQEVYDAQMYYAKTAREIARYFILDLRGQVPEMDTEKAGGD